MSITPANHDLWDRLLAGQLTEVFVLGGQGELCNVLSAYLPQTLGLEPIDVRAFRYSADGTLRPESEQAGLAEQLSAGEHWIAEGLAPAWAAPFMRRAEAIVFFDLPTCRARRPSAHTSSDGYGFVGSGSGGGGSTLLPLGRRCWYLLARANLLPEPTDADAVGLGPWSLWKGDRISVLAAAARTYFPEKLVHVTTRKQVGLLRQVRHVPHDL